MPAGQASAMTKNKKKAQPMVFGLVGKILEHYSSWD
jgi:hypothetical protein